MHRSGRVDDGELVGVVGGPRHDESGHEGGLSAAAASGNHDGPSLPADDAGVYEDAVLCGRCHALPDLGLQDGEDLAQISEKFNVSEDQLRLWNALKATDSLIPGQVVVIKKSTQADKPVVVAKAPPPPDAERMEKTEEPAAEEPQPPRLVTDDLPRTKTKRDDAAAEETPVSPLTLAAD